MTVQITKFTTIQDCTNCYISDWYFNTYPTLWTCYAFRGRSKGMFSWRPITCYCIIFTSSTHVSLTVSKAVIWSITSFTWCINYKYDNVSVYLRKYVSNSSYHNFANNGQLENCIIIGGSKRNHCFFLSSILKIKVNKLIIDTRIKLCI